MLTNHSTQPILLRLMNPPPPPATLFPYTKLFRSPAGRSQAPAPGVHPDRHDERAVHRGWSVRGARQGHRAADQPQDRKSTRLNSSHLVITYAVFCLKKKTHST